MFNTKNIHVSFVSLLSQANNKKIVLLYPWSNYRSLFLEKFLRNAEDGLLYYAHPKSITSLQQFLQDLIKQLRYAVPHFGENYLQPVLHTGDESSLGRALAAEFNRIANPTVFFIDDLDASVFSEDIGKFLAAFVNALDGKTKLALNSSVVTYAPWSNFYSGGDAIVLEPEREKDDLFFVVETAPKPQLEVFGFGKGTAFINGAEIVQWDGMLPRTLFFYLIDNPLITRDEIFQDFWPQPQVDIKDATDIFHVTKHKVGEVISRRMESPAEFELTQYKQGYYIPSDKVIRHYDVEVFLSALNRAARLDDDREREILLRRAIDIYKAPFLTALEAKWVLRRRAQLAHLYSEALIDLARIYDRSGNYDGELSLLSRAVELRPEREDVRRSYIQLLAEQDRVEEARKQYHLLVEELYKPLGMNIPAETLSLRQSLQLD